MSYQLDSSNKRFSAQSTYILGAFLFFILLTVFFLPVLGRYPHPVVPSWYPDVLEFLWTTWRLEGVVAGGEPLYSTKLVYAPEGASLLLHTLCEGVLLPITSLHTFLSPEWRLNVAFIVSFILNFFCSLSLFSALTSARGVVVLNSRQKS